MLRSAPLEGHTQVLGPCSSPLLFSLIPFPLFGTAAGPWLGQTSRNGSISDNLLGQGFVGLDSEALSSLWAWGG